MSTTTKEDMIEFFACGRPVPGGSKRAVTNKHTGKIALIDMSGDRVKNWRTDVRDAARKVYDGPLLDCPLSVDFVFVMPRPKKHFRTGKKSHMLRDDAPYYHTDAPDTTKLIRSTEDSLKHVLWTDDSRIAKQTGAKIYGAVPGAHITVTILEQQP